MAAFVWPGSTAQDEINGRLYARPSLVHEYAQATLTPPEVLALVRYREDIAGRRVLDLGCGAGRLATFLRPLTAHYVGFDISPYMLDHCRRHFADLQFLQGDMRSLTPFAAGSFDTVFAVANLFDAVSHEDRLRILAEVGRVLVRQGLLLFSSHNRNHPPSPPRLVWNRNPFRLLRGVADYWQACANHRRIKPRQRLEQDMERKARNREASFTAPPH